MVTNPVVAVVDDDPGVRGSVLSLLRSAGISGVGFEDAAGLLSRMHAERWACVVTDLHMPGMTGLELQSVMARLGWRLPLIVMTAFPTDAARRQALDQGATAFLTKPLDPDALLEAVEAVLQ